MGLKGTRSRTFPRHCMVWVGLAHIRVEAGGGGGRRESRLQGLEGQAGCGGGLS